MRTYDISRDINDTNSYTFDILNFKQGDANQVINLSLFDKGSSVNLTDYTATVNYKLSDGTMGQNTPTISGNLITITLDATMLSKTGYNEIEVRLTKDTTTTTTFGIKYRVLPSIAFDSIGTSTPTAPSTGNIHVSSGKYAILLVAGQSNAVGYDESPVREIFDAEHPRIKQLGFRDGNNLNIIQLTYCAENFQDMSTFGANGKGTKGIHLPLAKRLLKHIPDDYDLLVIPAAYGGTGFTRGGDIGIYDSSTKKPSANARRWGSGTPFYRAMCDRLEHALNLNPANYFIGGIWCQGENDAMTASNATAQKTAFVTMMDAFFKHFNTNYKTRVRHGEWSKKQWFIYDTVPEWAAKYPETTGIWEHYRTWNPDNFVSITFPTDASIYTNETNGVIPAGTKPSTTKDQWSHYGNNAFDLLVAPAVYKKMLDSNVI